MNYKPDDAEILHMRIYKTHLEKLKLAKPKVDDKPPKLNASLYYRPKTLEDDARKLDQILIENKKVVKRIAEIQKRKPNPEFFMTRKKKSYTNYNLRLNDLYMITRNNFELCNKILRKQSKYNLKDILKDWKRNEKIMAGKSRFPLYWHIKKNVEEKDKPLKVLSTLGKVSESKVDFSRKRPRCFFDVVLDSNYRPLGRIVFEIYDDYCPKTAKNFISLCNGNDNLTYRKCPFHLIVRDLLIVGGDIDKGNGTGGYSIYGEHFEDENFVILHRGRGVLTMANKGPNTNNSIFYISLVDLPSLDGKNVAFGRVIKGYDTLDKMQEFTSKYGRPVMRVIIANCGSLDNQINKNNK